MTTVALWYIGFAFANLLFAWVGLGLWGLSAERQVHKMRLAMFRNIIHQEIGWFDTHPSGELGAILTEYVYYHLKHRRTVGINLENLSTTN